MVIETEDYGEQRKRKKKMDMKKMRRKQKMSQMLMEERLWKLNVPNERAREYRVGELSFDHFWSVSGYEMRREGSKEYRGMWELMVLKGWRETMEWMLMYQRGQTGSQFWQAMIDLRLL